MTPIFKGGSSEVLGNYRPISVLPSLGKIFEKTLNDRLIDFLDHTKFFQKGQFGFRRKSNTSVAVTEVINYIHGNLDRKDVRVVSGLFLDLSKAFDTVNHRKLLDKLHSAGIRGVALDVFSNYLSQRSQVVNVDGVLSSAASVVTGVPQGSVLGPTLFLIFIDDIQSLDLKGNLFLYADDAAIFYSGRTSSQNLNNMNDDLAILSDYFRANLLTLNKKKSKYMHFHHFNVHVDDSVCVAVDGESIEKVSHFTYLGMVLDTHLTYRRHCDFVSSRMSAAIGALYKVKAFVPREALLSIYFSLVHSHLLYMVNIWGTASTAHLKPLQILQNRALKIVYGLPTLTRTVELFSEHARGILPVKGLHELQVLKYTRQCLNSELHHYEPLLFDPSISNLRDNLRLLSRNVSTLAGRRHFSFLGPQYFNRLPIDIRRIESTSSFIKSVKAHMLRSENLTRLLL